MFSYLQRTLLHPFVFLLILFPSTLRADTIAFFYALDKDWEMFLKETGNEAASYTVGTRLLRKVQCGPHEVIAVKMGSGPVETAISAQALLTRFPSDGALSIGPVAALRKDAISQGDWIRITSLIAYQKGSETKAGFTPHSQAKRTWATHPHFAYHAKNKKPTPMPLPFKIQEALAASGELFIASSAVAEKLFHKTAADVLEMNCFGLDAVLREHNIPWHEAWRIVSDFANDVASEQFRSFIERYDGAGGRAAARWIQSLPSSGQSPRDYPDLDKIMRPQDLHTP